MPVQTEVTEVKWVPDFDSTCQVCGLSPTVTGVDKRGKVVTAPGLCGPCCWGEADCIDPDNW